MATECVRVSLRKTTVIPYPLFVYKREFLEQLVSLGPTSSLCRPTTEGSITLIYTYKASTLHNPHQLRKYTKFQQKEIQCLCGKL